MPILEPRPDKLDDVAHIVQLALTPVFLLSGIGTLINVLVSRLGRVADQVDRIAQSVEQYGKEPSAEQQARLPSLRQRLLALDLAVILGAVGGASTCAAVLTLFVGALRDAGVASALYGFFGLAILCTIGALAAFLYEMLLASRIIRARVTRSERKIADGSRSSQ